MNSSSFPSNSSNNNINYAELITSNENYTEMITHPSNPSNNYNNLNNLHNIKYTIANNTDQSLASSIPTITNIYVIYFLLCNPIIYFIFYSKNLYKYERENITKLLIAILFQNNLLISYYTNNTSNVVVYIILCNNIYLLLLVCLLIKQEGLNISMMIRFMVNRLKRSNSNNNTNKVSEEKLNKVIGKDTNTNTDTDTEINSAWNTNNNYTGIIIEEDDLELEI